MFHDPSRFQFVAALEQNWPTILVEYQKAAGHAIDWFEKELYGDGWQVLGLFDFPHGRPLPDNVSRCPVTAKLISDHLPTHGAAGFSVLRPRTVIQPHRGYPGEFLRCHLALKVPAGDCGLRVGGEVRQWQEGRALVFDDRVEHEAWNRTAEDRVVLLIDFVPGYD